MGLFKRKTGDPEGAVDDDMSYADYGPDQREAMADRDAREIEKNKAEKWGQLKDKLFSHWNILSLQGIELKENDVTIRVTPRNAEMQITEISNFLAGDNGQTQAKTQLIDPAGVFRMTYEQADSFISDIISYQNIGQEYGERMKKVRGLERRKVTEDEQKKVAELVANTPAANDGIENQEAWLSDQYKNLPPDFISQEIASAAQKSSELALKILKLWFEKESLPMSYGILIDPQNPDFKPNWVQNAKFLAQRIIDEYKASYDGDSFIVEPLKASADELIEKIDELEQKSKTALQAKEALLQTLREKWQNMMSSYITQGIFGLNPSAALSDFEAIKAGYLNRSKEITTNIRQLDTELTLLRTTFTNLYEKVTNTQNSLRDDKEEHTVADHFSNLKARNTKRIIGEIITVMDGKAQTGGLGISVRLDLLETKLSSQDNAELQNAIRKISDEHDTVVPLINQARAAHEAMERAGMSIKYQRLIGDIHTLTSTLSAMTDEQILDSIQDIRNQRGVLADAISDYNNAKTNLLDVIRILTQLLPKNQVGSLMDRVKQFEKDLGIGDTDKTMREVDKEIEKLNKAIAKRRISQNTPTAGAHTQQDNPARPHDSEAEQGAQAARILPHTPLPSRLMARAEQFAAKTGQKAKTAVRAAAEAAKRDVARTFNWDMVKNLGESGTYYGDVDSKTISTLTEGERSQINEIKGSLDLRNCPGSNLSEIFPNLKIIHENLHCSNTLKALGILEDVGIAARLEYSKITSLENLKYVEYLYAPSSLIDLGSLNYAKKVLNIKDTQVSSLGSLRRVGNLYCPKSLNDLGDLTDVSILDISKCVSLTDSAIDAAINNGLHVETEVIFPSHLKDKYSLDKQTGKIVKIVKDEKGEKAEISAKELLENADYNNPQATTKEISERYTSRKESISAEAVRSALKSLWKQEGWTAKESTNLRSKASAGALIYWSQVISEIEGLENPITDELIEEIRKHFEFIEESKRFANVNTTSAKIKEHFETNASDIDSWKGLKAILEHYHENDLDNSNAEIAKLPDGLRNIIQEFLQTLLHLYDLAGSLALPGDNINNLIKEKIGIIINDIDAYIASLPPSSSKSQPLDHNTSDAGGLETRSSDQMDLALPDTPHRAQETTTASDGEQAEATGSPAAVVTEASREGDDDTASAAYIADENAHRTSEVAAFGDYDGRNSTSPTAAASVDAHLAGAQGQAEAPDGELSPGVTEAELEVQPAVTEAQGDLNAEPTIDVEVAPEQKSKEQIMTELAQIVVSEIRKVNINAESLGFTGETPEAVAQKMKSARYLHLNELVVSITNALGQNEVGLQAGESRIDDATIPALSSTEQLGNEIASRLRESAEGTNLDPQALIAEFSANMYRADSVIMQWINEDAANNHPAAAEAVHEEAQGAVAPQSRENKSDLLVKINELKSLKDYIGEIIDAGLAMTNQAERLKLFTSFVNQLKKISKTESYQGISEENTKSLESLLEGENISKAIAKDIRDILNLCALAKEAQNEKFAVEESDDVEAAWKTIHKSKKLGRMTLAEYTSQHLEAEIAYDILQADNRTKIDEMMKNKAVRQKAIALAKAMKEKYKSS